MLSRRFLSQPTLRQFSTSASLYAGHAKWQNVKHRKERQDASRSTRNTKFSHQIYIAAREGGSADPSLNFRLAMAVDNASRASVTKKVIEAAISRAAKSAGNPAENALSITYEGMGPGGVAFVVETLTDNKNRTAQNMRALFLRYKGSLSPVQFMFDRVGWLQLDLSGDESIDKNSPEAAFDKVFETCAEVPGVINIEEGETPTEVFVLTEPVMFNQALTEIKEMHKIKNMGLKYVPKEGLEVSKLSEDDKKKLDKLETELEDLDDVCDYYSNFIEE